MQWFILKFLISSQEKIWKVSDNQCCYQHESIYCSKHKFFVKCQRIYWKKCWNDSCLASQFLFWIQSSWTALKIMWYDYVSNTVQTTTTDKIINKSNKFSWSILMNCMLNAQKNCDDDEMYFNDVQINESKMKYNNEKILSDI